MLFKDEKHRNFYKDCIDSGNVHNDLYRRVLFYTLGLTDETRRNINSLYDFNERGVHFEGLFEGWQTSTSMRVTRMAFNLYNGFCGIIDEENKEANDDPALYSPDNLFCDDLMIYLFEAVKLRYPEYYHDI